MAVQISAGWWKSNKPKTLMTKELDKAFDDFETAKLTDHGRRNVYKLAVPDALKSMLNAIETVDNRANKVAHAQTKKNLTELRAAIQKDLKDREAAQTFLISVIEELKRDADALLKLLPDIETKLVALGRAGAQGKAAGGTPDDLRISHRADIQALVQAFTGAMPLVEKIEKISVAADKLKTEMSGVIARFLTNMAGIRDTFHQAAKQITTGNFEVLEKIGATELVLAQGKLKEIIHEW